MIINFQLTHPPKYLLRLYRHCLFSLYLFHVDSSVPTAAVLPFEAGGLQSSWCFISNVSRWHCCFSVTLGSCVSHFIKCRSDSTFLKPLNGQQGIHNLWVRNELSVRVMVSFWVRLSWMLWVEGWTSLC